MKSKEEILTEHANADGLRLNNSDWGDWLLKAMDIYAAQEVEKAIAEHEAKQWHKYPEEKPENNGAYLVRIQTHIIKPTTIIGYYQLNGFVEFNEYVIAWRELPKFEEGGSK